MLNMNQETIHRETNHEKMTRFGKESIMQNKNNEEEPIIPSNNPHLNFHQIYDAYLDDMSEKLKPSTLRNKQSIFETKILPYFRDMNITSITPLDIRNWQIHLIKTHPSLKPTYLRTVNYQLNAMMTYAKKLYDLPRNPCDSVDLMGNTCYREMRVWSPEEYFRFREVLPDELTTTCFDVLYWTGIRVGELAALSASDIDITHRDISISKTFLVIRGRELIQSPKTTSSIRHLKLPVFLNEELRQYMKNVPSATRIFPINNSWLTYRIKKYSRIAGVREIRCHDLRHSAASLLIHEGFDILEVSRHLGHRRPSTTLNTYAHLFHDGEDSIANRLDSVRYNGMRKHS